MALKGAADEGFTLQVLSFAYSEFTVIVGTVFTVLWD